MGHLILQWGAEAGWWRFFGHFVFFAFPPVLVGYVVYKTGRRVPRILIDLAFGGAIALVVLLEVGSTLRGVQMVDKAVIDAIAKLAGAGLGLYSMNWWHRGKPE